MDDMKCPGCRCEPNTAHADWCPELKAAVRTADAQEATDLSERYGGVYEAAEAHVAQNIGPLRSPSVTTIVSLTLDAAIPLVLADERARQPHDSPTEQEAREALFSLLAEGFSGEELVDAPDAT